MACRRNNLNDIIQPNLLWERTVAELGEFPDDHSREPDPHLAPEHRSRRRPPRHGDAGRCATER